MLFFAASFALTIVLSFLALHFFPRLGLMDRPANYGLSRAPIPYFGGLVIIAAIVPLVLFFLPLSQPLVALLAGLVLVAAVSFLDDARGLSPFFRLATQIVAGLMLVAGGIGISSISSPLGGMIDFSSFTHTLALGDFTIVINLISALFIVGWVVLLMNAMNWLDGVAGLSSGLSGLAALIIFFLAQRPDFHFFDQSVVIQLSAIVAGAALAFLLFNAAPAKILLGDTGSMTLGFLIAALSVYSGGKIATAALVLALPIFDALFVIAWRLLSGRRPWTGGEWDREKRAVHLHHRMLAAGFSERQVLLFFLGMSLLFGVLALGMENTLFKIFAFVLLGVFVLVVQQVLARLRMS